MPRHIRNALIVAVSLMLVVTGSFAAFSIHEYVYPASDQPTKSDVIVVLGPPEATRIAIAQKMLDAGLSQNLLVSVPAWGVQSKDELPICSTQVKHTYTVTCFTPAPFTTRGEAHELQAMAAEHGWKSATVITYTPHIDRARIIVSRCFSGKLSMVEDRKPLSYAEWGYAFFYQTAGFVKVLLDQNC